jgi:PAS domain S-box-containing protein
MTAVHGADAGRGEPEEWHESWTALERSWEVESRANPKVMTVHDASGHVLYVTPAARRLFGVCDEAELLGCDLLALVHPDDAVRVRRAFCGWMSGRSSNPVTCRIAGADGAWRALEAIGTRDGSAATGLTVVITAHEADWWAVELDSDRAKRATRALKSSACGDLAARSHRTLRR